MNINDDDVKIIDGNDINKLVDDESDPSGLFDFNCVQKSPCWQVKIDDEQQALLFLIDNVEKVSCPLEVLVKPEITMDEANKWIGMLRNGNFTAIKKDLRGKRKKQ